MPRLIPRLALYVALLAACLAAPAAPAQAQLMQLPGDAGCLKGFGGKPWVPCDGRIAGMYDVGSVAISPDGRFLYGVSVYGGFTMDAAGSATDVAGGTVVAFARNPVSGELNQLAGDKACVRDREALTPVTLPCKQTAIGLRGAKTIVLSPDGRFAYVAALENESIAVFARDPIGGGLRQLPGTGACVQDVHLESGRECPVLGRGIHGVRWVTVSPDGRHLYASSPVNDAIAAFARNRHSGKLTQLPGAGACIEDRLARRAGSCPSRGIGLNYPRSLTVSPDGMNVYVASDSADSTYLDDAHNGDAVAAFRRDPLSGKLTQLEGPAACIKDRLASSRTACTTVGNGLLDAMSVTVSPDNKNVYVASDASRRGALAVFARDPGNGALTQLPGKLGCLSQDPRCTFAGNIRGANAITLSRDGKRAYVAAFFGENITVYNRRPNGTLTNPTIPATRGMRGPRLLTLSPDNKHAYIPASSSGTLTVYNVQTGGG